MTSSPQRSATPSRLYVSNLSQSATLASLRELFGHCGEVVEVEFAAERSSHSSASAAHVTMANFVDAEKAVQNLHGRLHCGRVLMISLVSGEPRAPRNARERAAEQARADENGVAMTQQYRDRHASTYELNCAGKRLTLRFIFPRDDAQAWQVEARMGPDASAVGTGSAMTRDQAFRVMIDDWARATAGHSSPELDWERVAAALRAVRAL